MMARLLKCLALGIVLLTAATQSGAETRVALVIGNGAYETIGRLANPVNDAKLIGQTLSQVGFDVTSATDQTEDQMGETIDRFVEKARLADVAVVYYAGHGIQKDGENFLMPVDTQLRSENAISREGISLNDLTEALAAVPISMIFLDACRNNPFAEALMSEARSDGRSAGVKRGLAVVRTTGDMLVTFATLPNTVALDGTGMNSPFAKALAQQIPTPNVEVSVLMKRVTADVMVATQEEQRPQQLSQMMTEFYFRRDEPQTAVAAPVAQQPERSLLTVYPPRVGVGDEVSVVADLGEFCTPSFFNLSPGRKFTPIPLEFFKKTPLNNRQTRFEISPGSRFGLVVQPQDEKGENVLGYFCEPSGQFGQEALKSTLRDIVKRIGVGEENGAVETADHRTVHFQARPFWIE